jgi:hypothetical protein
VAPFLPLLWFAVRPNKPTTEEEEKMNPVSEAKQQLAATLTNAYFTAELLHTLRAQQQGKKHEAGASTEEVLGAFEVFCSKLSPR